MRENCTYGSMRGRTLPTGRPALRYTLEAPGRKPLIGHQFALEHTSGRLSNCLNSDFTSLSHIPDLLMTSFNPCRVLVALVYVPDILTPVTSYCFGAISAYFWRQIYSESASYLSTFGAKTNQDTVPYTSQHSTPSVKAHTSLRRDDRDHSRLCKRVIRRSLDHGLVTGLVHAVIA